MRKKISATGNFIRINLLMVTCFGLFACNQPDEKTGSKSIEDGEITMASPGMNFDMPDTIYSGWNRFTYNNESPDTHFFLFEKYPEGRNLQDFQQSIAPVFQEGMDSIIAGNMDGAMTAFGKLPAWSQQVVYSGGSGLIGPGKTSHTTIRLDPGIYVVECYVKNPQGKFHSAMGMATQVNVKADSSAQTAPNANIHIELSSDSGMQLLEQPAAGEQTFAVHFKDQKTYENFLGHDVHLVRLTGNAGTDTLQQWMNWLAPEGFVSPVPAGFEFLGGVQDMPAGHTGYFTVDLAPGNYVLIAELPEAAKKNMLQTFSIK